MQRALRPIVVATLLLIMIAPSHASSDPHVETRVQRLLEQMSLDEKIDLLGGVNFFDVRGVPRLGVPSLAMADGPFGVRRSSRSNAMPGGVALAATWNEALVQRVGEQLGRDARARGVHFHLAPGVNIYRSPLNGRNFEYFGEDPHLAARMAVAFIRGVQSQGVGSTVKHFFGNNAEHGRHTSNSIIDERTAREIYLPAFEAAVKEAKVAAVMGAYNLVNGEHMSQARRYNVDLLKGEWGFDGVLMSDWDATYDTLAAANGGLDVETPSGKFLNRATLKPLLESGAVSMDALDDKVRRILRTAARMGWLDRPQLDATIPRVNGAGRAVALEAAREAIVLLKNDEKMLPLDSQQLRSIAVIGPTAYPAMLHGGGSVTVAPYGAISLLEALSERAHLNVHYARGLPTLDQVANTTVLTTEANGGARGVNIEEFDNAELAGEPKVRVAPVINQGAPLDLTAIAAGEFDGSRLAPPRRTSTRWTGFFTPERRGAHDLFVHVGGFSRVFGHRLYVDDRLVLDRWTLKVAALESITLDLDQRPHKIVLEHRTEAGSLDGATPFVRFGVRQRGEWVDEPAKQLARAADVVIIAAGFDTSSETEDWDRTFQLPPGQDELIRQVAAANPRAVVTLTAGGAVDARSWQSQVRAIVHTWYLGQEGGAAIADVLFGEINPSGRLPFTYELNPEDNPSFAHYHPAPRDDRVHYKEGVFVGYRGFDRNGVQPLYPFGHGLSYTSFEYGALTVSELSNDSAHLFEASFEVKNSGERAGAVTAQLYVADVKSSVPRPPKELKAFAKVNLHAGESRRITLPLDARAFAFYDVKAKAWRIEPGEFKVLVGDSAGHLPLSASVRVRGALLR